MNTKALRNPLVNAGKSAGTEWLVTVPISHACMCRNHKLWCDKNLKLWLVQKFQTLLCAGKIAGAEWRVAGDAGVAHAPPGTTVGP